jgi:TonB-linked SusC/RagA family outer membrane protein
MQLKVFGFRFRTLLAMKLLILLTAVACITASANGFSQTVTLSVTNAPLEKVFKEIKKQTGYTFVYIRAQLKNSLPVSCHVENAGLKEVLDICFIKQRLSFVIEDRYIVIQTKEAVAEAPSPNLSSINIKGRVLNENSEPIEGASVLIKGTTKGTITDGEGYFELTDVDENAVLVVTGVSIESVEQKVTGRSPLLVNVRTKITAQKEVTINAGYYKTTDKLKTGNISRVDAKIISKQPVSNPLEALEGRMAGVYIQQTSGVSGSGFNIEIRGLNSLRKFTAQNNGNLPLYVVDGTPFTSSSLDQNTSIANQIAPLVSPLNSINPSDIESIEVLKDADATAIYGSRGANGVVLITTKKGKSGKTKIDFTVYTGVGKITHTMNLLNTQQYLQMRHEAFRNDNTVPQSFNYDVNGTWDTTRFTDWQKLMMGETAHITSVQGSISGGNQNTQFLLGGGYFRETTVFPGDFADQKGSAHFSLNHSSENKKFTTTLLANYLVDHNNLPQADPTHRAIFLAPDAPPIYNADGSLNWASNTWINPFSSFLQPYKGNTNNLIANAVLSYQPLPGLNIKTSLGYNSIQMQQINFIPARRNPTGSSNYSDHSIASWIVEPQAEFQKTFAKSKLSVLVGSTFQQNVNQAQSFFATGFTSDALIENPSAAASVFPSFFDYTEYKYNALFVRVNYKWFYFQF